MCLCFIILSIIDRVALPPVCWVTLWIPRVFACLQWVLSSYLNVPTTKLTYSVVFILECAICDNQKLGLSRRRGQLLSEY